MHAGAFTNVKYPTDGQQACDTLSNEFAGDRTRFIPAIMLVITAADVTRYAIACSSWFARSHRLDKVLRVKE